MYTAPVRVDYHQDEYLQPAGLHSTYHKMGIKGFFSCISFNASNNATIADASGVILNIGSSSIKFCH